MPGKSQPLDSLGTRYMPKKNMIMGKHEAYLACCCRVVALRLRMLLLQLLLRGVGLLLHPIVPLVGLGLAATYSPIVLVLLVHQWGLVYRLGCLEGLSLGVSLLLVLLHFFSLTMIIINYTRLCAL